MNISVNSSLLALIIVLQTLTPIPLIVEKGKSILLSTTLNIEVLRFMSGFTTSILTLLTSLTYSFSLLSTPITLLSKLV